MSDFIAVDLRVALSFDVIHLSQSAPLWLEGNSFFVFCDKTLKIVQSQIVT